MLTICAKYRDSEPTQIHHGKNSETAIQWSSLRYNRTLALHPNVKLHINDRLLFFVSTMALYYDSIYH